MTLIELLLAVVVGALLLAGISGLVKLGVDAQSYGRTSNELAYQGRFALERMSDKARTLPPKVLAAPAASTTGDWFAPAGCAGAACVMYCMNAGNQLVETITSDATCTGTTVIANYVSSFSASLPSGMGAVDRSVAAVSLTLSNGNATTVLTSSIRLGGGTL